MKFAVGYQLAEPDEESFAEILREYAENISEVYFPWIDSASGRAPMGVQRGYADWTAQRRLEEDLERIHDMGIKLDLLLNANCYGGYAVSQYLENHVVSLLEHLEKVAGGADVVTTTSLMVARTVKESFPGKDVRASVNMRIGTVKGMQYVSGLFDSYYIQRELNRRPEVVKELKDWAAANGKKLCMLANSGCLNFCSGQTFHDNMVAHEKEIDEVKNLEGWTPHVCWNFFKERKNWVTALQNSWVRPEDIYHYEGMFEVVKLATRMHSRPWMVIDAYVKGKYTGNLLDLFEPGHGPAFYPNMVDNTLFPGDWWERTAGCDKRCHECGYCSEVLAKVLVPMETKGDADEVKLYE